MIDFLHSVYLKVDSSISSLTKRALAQIVLKIISEKRTGISSKQIGTKLKALTGVKVGQSDIEKSASFLIDEKKVAKRGSQYFITDHFKIDLDQIIEESNKLHKSVIKKWFSNSETYQQEDGFEKIENWFKQLLIKFFEDYSYDWINDLKAKEKSVKRKKPQIEKIILESLRSDIKNKADHEWLKKQFVNFIESENKIDNELIWIYGSCMFSARLITARNYVDDFAIEVFRDSVFILDTNILMILELESSKFYDAFQELENTFKRLNIEPVYLQITKEEYGRAINGVGQSTLNSIKKFSHDVIAKVNSDFIKTAYQRGCKSLEDFERFFETISDIPKTIYRDLEIDIETSPELESIIANGGNDLSLKKRINRIHKRRTGDDKRNNPKTHDAGLIKGVEYLLKEKKAWVLTKDGTLREYASEYITRDESPIAIGLDSFLQIMAINQAGTENTASNFAPLFSRLVKSSLLPEKNTFRTDDLEIILRSKLEIEKMPDEFIKNLAKDINKLRFQGVPEDEIALEIRRQFESYHFNHEAEMIKGLAEKESLKREVKSLKDSNKKIIERSSEKIYETKLSKLKRSIVLSWLFLLVVLPLFVFCVVYFMQLLSFGNILTSIVSIIGSGLFMFILRRTESLKLQYSKNELDKLKEESNQEAMS